MFSAVGSVFGALMTPIGKIIGGALAVVAVVVAIYTAGYRAHAAVSQEQQYKSELEAARRDLKAADEAAKVAELLMSETNRRSVEARKKANDFAKSLARSPACTFTDADVKRLLDIRKRGNR